MSVTAKLHIITIEGYWRDFVRATAMITSVLMQKSQNETQGTENVVPNFTYLVLNITWKASNNARLVGLMTGVLRLHDSILKFEKKERGTSIQDYSISDMVELNGAFIDTAMITISVKLTNKKNEQNRQKT